MELTEISATTPMGPNECPNCPGMYHWPHNCPHVNSANTSMRQAMLSILLGNIKGWIEEDPKKAIAEIDKMLEHMDQ